MSVPSSSQWNALSGAGVPLRDACLAPGYGRWRWPSTAATAPAIAGEALIACLRTCRPYLCHERTLTEGGVWCCIRDEGGPLGAGLQGQAPNHLELHRLSAVCGERRGKVGTRSRQVWVKETSTSEPSMKRRNVRDDVKTGGYSVSREESGRNLLTAQMASGVQVA